MLHAALRLPRCSDGREAATLCAMIPRHGRPVRPRREEGTNQSDQCKKHSTQAKACASAGSMAHRLGLGRNILPPWPDLPNRGVECSANARLARAVGEPVAVI